MVWVVLVTWYISDAGGSWNLSGECSFDLFTACKQAYLVVLTVNVIVVFLLLWCFETFFFLSCLCSVGKSSTNLWLAGPHTKLVQTLIDSVLFLSNVYCQWWMYLFLVLPSPLQRICSVCETEVEAGPPFFFFFVCFSFWGFQAENQKWDTKHSH